MSVVLWPGIVWGPSACWFVAQNLSSPVIREDHFDDENLFWSLLIFIDLIDHHHNCLLYPRAPLKPKFENVVVTATLDNLEISDSYNIPKYPILKYSHMSNATGWLFKVFTQWSGVIFCQRLQLNMWDKKYSFVGSSHIVHISIFPNVFKTTILKTNLLKMNFNSQD